MFTTLSMKKVDIQEANKHLQLVHVRNTELEQELELKSTQLSRVEAQLEDVTRVKQNELSTLTGEIDTLKSKLASQSKETEQWKMLVHERDVMIAKLQTRCRQLEELESHVYECRPSLEALLSLTYQLDGTEIDSQTAAKPYLADAESEAEYAEPDAGDGPDVEPPDLPLTFNLVNSKSNPENGHLMSLSVSKVKRYLQIHNQSNECDVNANKEKGAPKPRNFASIEPVRGPTQEKEHCHGSLDHRLEKNNPDLDPIDKSKFGRRTVVEISV